MQAKMNNKTFAEEKSWPLWGTVHGKCRVSSTERIKGEPTGDSRTKVTLINVVARKPRCDAKLEVGF